jgi:hypothetical protein
MEIRFAGLQLLNEFMHYRYDRAWHKWKKRVITTLEIIKESPPGSTHKKNEKNNKRVRVKRDLVICSVIIARFYFLLEIMRRFLSV